MNFTRLSKRMTKLVSRFVLVLAMVCLVVAALPADGFTVMAATNTYNIASADGWNQYVSSAATGDTVNLVVTASFDATGKTMNVPEGVTVNLYMGNKTISQANNGWENVSMTLINNQGTLNVYAGTATNPNSGNAFLSIDNTRTDMGADKNNEACTANLVVIQNSSKLTVNSGVSISCNGFFEYSSAELIVGGTSANTNVLTMTTGIYNTSTASTCEINGASVSVSATSKGFAYDYNAPQSEYAFARGVLGGTVTVNGSANISAHAETYYDAEMGKTEGVYSVVESYCIASSGKIVVNGGDFSCSALYNGNSDKDIDEYEYSTMNTGIIAYKNQVPVIADGTFSVKVNDPATSTQGLNQYTVSTVSKEFKTPTSSNPGRSVDVFNTLKNAASSGNYLDETGYAHTPGSANSSGGTVVKTVNHGAINGTGSVTNTRIHLIYRFWETSGKSNLLDYAIAGTDDARITNKAELYINGTENKNNTSKVGNNNDPQVLTVRMYESANPYYWANINVGYSTGGSKWFNNFVDEDFSVMGGVMTKAGEGTSAAGNNYTDYTFNVTSADALYVYVDYVQAPSSPVQATFGSSNTVEVTYTGHAPVPNVTPGFPVKIIKSGNAGVDWTKDYNLAGVEDNSLLSVAYSYVNNANAEDAGIGLPVNAGTYTVTYTLEEDTEIDRQDNVYSKNREELTGSFTLRINKAYALRGNLAEKLTLVYGEKLGDKLSLNGLQAEGVNNDAPTGTFMFTNGTADSNSFKDVCTDNILQITWNPSANAVNYQQTTFTVYYTVTPATLTVTPTAASIVYGNAEYSNPYSAVISGLVANDNTDTKKATILAALAYTINYTGNDYIDYVPGGINVGSYFIQPKLATIPAFLSNYNVVYNYGEGYAALAVTARPLTVSAVAQSRAYDPNDTTAVLNMTITDGIFESDIVSIGSVVGNLKVNTVGKQYVYDVDKTVATNALTGADKDNYTVSFLNFEDGASLPMVEIVKAVPEITEPIVSGIRYYTLDGRLSDINLNGNDYTPEIAGTWSWDKGDTNPQVLVDTYPATFTPDDTDNYLTYSVEIPVEILASDVYITYNASLTYGDPRPDLTQYSYTCATDTAFSIAEVVTSGNIYPSTTYDQFDGVLAEGYVVTLTNSNYKDVNGNYNLIVQDGLITVAPKAITVTADDASITYGESFNILFGRSVSYSDDFVGSDTPNALTADGSEPDYIFSSDYDYNNNYKAGTYTIYVTMLAEDMSPNYSISFASGTLKVDKAELVVAGTTVNVNYGEAVDLSTAYTLSGLAHGETTLAEAVIGNPTPVTTYYAGASVIDGGYGYYFDFTGVVSENYRVSTSTGVIIVNKVNPVIITAPTASVSFGSPLSEAAFSTFEASVDGKFVFDAADAKPPYSSNPYNQDAIVYSASFIPADTTNYNVLSNQKVVLTIEKCVVTGVPMITGYPMEGQTLTADLTAMYPADETNYTFAWTVNGSVVSTAKTYTVAAENEVIVLTVTAAGPYTGSADATVTASRALTLADLNTILTIAGLSDKTYNATQQGVDVSNANAADVAMGNITVKYNGSVTRPTNAGTYGVTVDIALPNDFSSMTVTEVDGQTYADGKKIYAPASNISIGTYTIAPAAFNVNVTVADKEYDGTNVATAVSTDIINGAIVNNGVEDAVAFDADNASYLFDSADVGTGKTVTVGGAALTGASKDNYVLYVTITNADAGVITAKTLNAAIVAFDREYEAGNTAVEVAFDIDLTSLAAGDTDADVYFNPATASVASDKAGTQEVTVDTGSISLAGSKAGNYVWNITNLDAVTVLIDKATPDYPMPEVGILTYDSGRTLDDISLGDSRWSWVNGNIKPGAGTVTYTAVFMPDDTVNYKTVTKDVTLVINKAQIVITATSYTLTYGDAAPTYGYTVTGLTGADTLSAVATGYAIVNCAYDLGSPVRADGYPVTVTGYFSSANYDFRYVQGLVTVNPRPVYTNATVTDRNFSASNYDVAINFSELTNIYSPDKGNVALASYGVTGTVENNAAGTRAVTYTAPALTGSAAGNYVLVVNPSELTVEILKAQPLNVVMPTTATVIYGSPLSTAVFTSSKEGDGTFRLENASSYPAAHGIFSDVYKVEFIPTDSVNYATLTAYITLTVEKKPLAVSAAISGSCTEGETLYIVTSAIENTAAPHIIYEWYRIKNAGDSIYTGVKLAEGVSYTLTDKDVGYYIACAVTVNNAAPYTCDAIAVSDSMIEEVYKTFWQKLWAWFHKIFSAITQLFGSIGG